MENHTQVASKVILDLFTQQLSRADKVIDGFTDEQLAKEVAPGRNTGVYLLGHLAAVHEAMLPLLGLGEVQHPELVDVFLKNPDKSGLPKPATSQLREYWKAANATLVEKLSALTPEQWFERHTSVSEEDFKKEPHRNRLNIVAGRTTHMTYHIGQMALIK
jgi:uncharacterized damage-inducible protein DinB